MLTPRRGIADADAAAFDPSTIGSTRDCSSRCVRRAATVQLQKIQSEVRAIQCRIGRLLSDAGLVQHGIELTTRRVREGAPSRVRARRIAERAWSRVRERVGLEREEQSGHAGSHREETVFNRRARHRYRFSPSARPVRPRARQCGRVPRECRSDGRLCGGALAGRAVARARAPALSLGSGSLRRARSTRRAGAHPSVGEVRRPSRVSSHSRPFLRNSAV